MVKQYGYVEQINSYNQSRLLASFEMSSGRLFAVSILGLFIAHISVLSIIPFPFLGNHIIYYGLFCGSIGAFGLYFDDELIGINVQDYLVVLCLTRSLATIKSLVL